MPISINEIIKIVNANKLGEPQNKKINKDKNNEICSVDKNPKWKIMEGNKRLRVNIFILSLHSLKEQFKPIFLKKK